MNLIALYGSNFKQYLVLLFFYGLLLTAAQNTERNLSLEKWQFKGVNNGKYKWFPAKVPGTVHTDLLANKFIS